MRLINPFNINKVGQIKPAGTKTLTLSMAGFLPATALEEAGDPVRISSAKKRKNPQGRKA